MALVSVKEIVWEKCWEIREFGKKFKACLSLQRDGTTFQLCAKIDNREACIGIVDGCVPVYKVLGIDIEVCLSDIDFDGDRLRRLCFEIKGCIDTPFGKLCERLLKECIDVNFILLDGSDTTIPYASLVNAPKAQELD
ncbi:MAG: hypothetical protein F6K19_41875 [Cyanothece sp. SIO1E1]|nr:hypothetical protein [Cyanothece sp. SIO1E1]